MCCTDPCPDEAQLAEKDNKKKEVSFYNHISGQVSCIFFLFHFQTVQLCLIISCKYFSRAAYDLCKCYILHHRIVCAISFTCTCSYISCSHNNVLCLLKSFGTNRYSLFYFSMCLFLVRWNYT